MRRVATSTFLASWIGFLAVSGITAMLAMFQAAGVGVPAVPGLTHAIAETAGILRTHGNAEALATTVAALMQFMIAALLGLALWLVHGRALDDQTAGEKLAAIGLGSVGALVLTMHLCGFAFFDRFGTLLGIETVVALSMVAVLLDRMTLVGDEDDVSDEADFRAAITLIGRQMARDAARQGRSDADAVKQDAGR